MTAHRLVVYGKDGAVMLSVELAANTNYSWMSTPGNEMTVSRFDVTPVGFVPAFGRASPPAPVSPPPDPDGECPCGLVRRHCDYHKEAK